VKGRNRTLLDFLHGELTRAGVVEGHRLTGSVLNIEESSQLWMEFSAVRIDIVTKLTVVVVEK
jgi:hypothetical protein